MSLDEVGGVWIAECDNALYEFWYSLGVLSKYRRVAESALPWTVI
jgi:hypothetical protein